VTAAERRSVAALLAALLSVVGRAAAGDPAPPRGEPPALAAELARLDGQRVEVAPDRASYRILDIAGEGAPLVGVVERRGASLWLRAEVGPPRRLVGPLAVPRIAGPGYKVWVIGRVAPDGELSARRLGILARPVRR